VTGFSCWLRVLSEEREKEFVYCVLDISRALTPLYFAHLPVKNSESRAGHDLFSSEKPEAIERMEEERKEKILTKVA